MRLKVSPLRRKIQIHVGKKSVSHCGTTHLGGWSVEQAAGLDRYKVHSAGGLVAKAAGDMPVTIWLMNSTSCWQPQKPHNKAFFLLDV